MVVAATRAEAAVERLDVRACTIPTDEPESDGTLEWDSTTIVLVEAHAGGETGLGYTYCDAAAAHVVGSQLADAREAIGDDVELFVDANGAFPAKQALAWAERYALEWSVTWFEEPVSSADFAGLRLVREHGPAGLEIAAGEYAYVPADFRNL